MKQIYLLCLLLLATGITASAQNAMRREGKIKVVINGDTLRNAWAGGLHTPQFSEVDIDGDGHNDLVIYNRGILASNTVTNGYKLLTFRNHGTPGQIDYEYKPEWEAIFPSLLFWVKLYDMTCDGIPDLLVADTSQNSTLDWYEGFRDAEGLIYFEPRGRMRTSFGGAPVELPRADYPGVGDVDRDGDVDFINYSWLTSSFAFYRNYSIEAGNACADTMMHDAFGYCWGQFDVTDIEVRTNVSCPLKTDPLPITGGNRHNGGSVLVIDLDGDGVDDLLYGDVDKKNVYALYNVGTPANALIDSVDYLFPSYDVPASVPFYPLSFHFDANNDGKKDIIVAPSEPFLSSSKNSVLFYENISTNDSVKLQFVGNNFLENTMIDLGRGAFPTFADVNGDSLIDMVVGNHGYYRDSTINTAQLALFLNVGTAEVPIFELADEDWLGFSDWYFVDSEVVMALAPAFGDIDGDGDLDLFVGDTSGYITFFENIAGPDTAMVFAAPVRNYFDLNSTGGGYSAPYVYDVNGDGAPDLLIGNRLGRIRYFQNRGLANNPIFDQVPTNSFFGQVSVKTDFSLDGYSRPQIASLDTTGALYLLTGSEEGWVFGYAFNPDSIYQGSFDLVFTRYSGIDAGERSSITIADITNDGKPEMIVGNYRGGLEFFTLSDTIEYIVSSPLLLANNIFVSVAPNPTAGEVTIHANGLTKGVPLTYSVVGLLGNLVLQNAVETNGEHWQGTISLGGQPSGLYFVRIAQGQQHTTIKLIKY